MTANIRTRVGIEKKIILERVKLQHTVFELTLPLWVHTL